MFVVILTYKKSIELIDQHLIGHRKFLDEGYQNNLLVASGPKNPRDGGILISQAKNRQQLEDFIKRDPFYEHELADYEIMEFDPVKYHTNFACFI